LNKKNYYIYLLFFLCVFTQKKALAQDTITTVPRETEIKYEASESETDTIYHINGNILTGDLKSLSYGVISYKMDGMGTISIDEIKINTIISKKEFEIKMQNDVMLYGSFEASNEYRTLYVVNGEEKTLVHIDDIVEIYRIKRDFWMRTSGNFSLGFNYSKGSSAANLSFSGNLDYRKKKAYYTLTWNDNNSYQGDTLSSTNTNIALAWQRLIKKSWSFQTAISATQNSELGTKIRWGVDLTGIKDIVYNDWNRLYVGSGFSTTKETAYGQTTSQYALSGLFQVVWKVYKYSSPKIWVDANISYLPYITEKRSRVSINFNPSTSIFSDNFKVGITSYFNYDSDPSEDAYSSNDYGITLSLGYSFH
jgi:hypothetical protein